MGRQCVLVFSKPPRPGRVKTRLIGDLSADQAAELHAAFLADTVSGLSEGAFELWMSWALEAGEPLPENPALVHGIRQEGVDLGARLHHGLSMAGERFEQVAAIGSDSPHLPLELVERAFEILDRGAEAVIGPATDGGFYLIALCRAAIRREIFNDIPWSSGRELEAVRKRCRRIGLALAEIEQVPDIDQPEDLDYLTALLEKGEAHCPATAQVLRRWGRLSS